MPSRKQRRRREKTFRHDYVWEDEEGHEAERLADLKPELQRERALGATAKSERRSSRGASTARGGRTVQPASWLRVGKRALLFAPLMFVAVSLLDHTLTPMQHAAQTVFLLAFFLPFSYVMDTVAYRMYLRRTGQTAPPRGERPTAGPAKDGQAPGSSRWSRWSR